MRIATYLLLAAFAAAPLALTGCDRTVHEQTKTTTDDDGRIKTEKKTVTEDLDGNRTVTKEKRETTDERP